MTYYDEIASGYNELHKEEQEKKINIILDNLRLTKADKALDVGCGTGFFIDKIKHRCKNVTGVDPSEELLKICRKKNKEQNVKLIKAIAENLPFNNDCFDVVVSVTSIQNFDNIKKGLDEIKRVGKQRFALSFLKKSNKRDIIEKLIMKTFKNFKRIEQEKDIVYIKDL